MCSFIDNDVRIGLLGFALFLQILFMFFQIFDELVLPTQLVVISKMVNLLMGSQLLLVELGDELLFTPNDIPRIVLYLLVSSLLEGIKDAVGKICFILDRRSSLY